jgi:hypothetical protein
MTTPIPTVAAWLAIVLPLAAQQAETPPPARPTPSPAAIVDQALHVAKAKNRRVLVAVLGDDELSAAIGTQLKDPTISRKQLLYEFAVATLKPTDTDALHPLGVDPAKTPAPLLAVLDGDRRVLARVERDALAVDGPPLQALAIGKLLAPHHCAPQDAEALLKDALAACKREQKTLLLHFDAPW